MKLIHQAGTVEPEMRVRKSFRNRLWLSGWLDVAESKSRYKISKGVERMQRE
jgi:hypothetical protein